MSNKEVEGSEREKRSDKKWGRTTEIGKCKEKGGYEKAKKLWSQILPGFCSANDLLQST